MLSTLRLWYPSDVVALLIDVAVLALWGTGVGYAFHRMPASWFSDDRAVTRLRSWERDGRVWDDLVAVRRWKGRLPDAGGLFSSGFPKKQMSARDSDYLRRFVAETRRAELVHLVVLAIGPVFFLWNPLWLAAVMVVYGVLANVPFIIIQRYNRARLLRVLAHRSRPPRQPEA